jgi:hypothetical protein
MTAPLGLPSQLGISRSTYSQRGNVPPLDLPVSYQRRLFHRLVFSFLGSSSVHTEGGDPFSNYGGYSSHRDAGHRLSVIKLARPSR